jgi:hypothetical protein
LSKNWDGAVLETHLALSVTLRNSLKQLHAQIEIHPPQSEIS